MLDNSLIFIFSVVALFSALFARINVSKSYATPLFLVSFVCVAFCVTYAFLLGVDIEEVLTYILAYALIAVTVFCSDNEKAHLSVASGVKE